MMPMERMPTPSTYAPLAGGRVQASDDDEQSFEPVNCGVAGDGETFNWR